MNPAEGARMIIDFAKKLGGPGTRKAAINAANRGKALIVPQTPADTGLLRQSWHVVPTQHGAQLRNDHPVASVIERGARPHWPPWEPIVRWVARKLQVNLSGADLSDYGKIDGGGLSPEQRDEVRGMAYGICAKLAAKGQAPTFFVRRHIRTLQVYFIKELQRVMREREGSGR